MTGVKGRSGGARSGSGRKRKSTVEQQQTRRDILLAECSPDEWRLIVRQIMKQAKAGTIMAILPYLPYLLGSPKQEIEMSGQVDHTVTTIETIRKAIGIAS